MRCYNSHDITSVYSLNWRKLLGCFSIYILGTGLPCEGTGLPCKGTGLPCEGTRLPCEGNRFTGTVAVTILSSPRVQCHVILMLSPSQTQPTTAQITSSIVHGEVGSGDTCHVLCLDGMWNYGISRENNRPHSKFSAVRVDSAVFEVLLSSSILRSSTNLTVSQ